MAIEGLMEKREVGMFKLGRPDVAEAVGVTIEAYKALGFSPDVDRATETMTAEFESVAQIGGYDGRLFVPVPKEVPFQQLLDTAEGKRPDEVQPAYKYVPLWTPGNPNHSGYTAEELDQAPSTPQARLAVFNASDTGVDPLLHYLGLPYDREAMGQYGGETTQKAKLGEDTMAFEDKRPELELIALDHRDFALMALMDRIRGVDPEDMILSRGFMRTVHLGRKAVDGGSVVGVVDSDGGQLGFGGSFGGAADDVGVGLSVGQKLADA